MAVRKIRKVRLHGKNIEFKPASRVGSRSRSHVWSDCGDAKAT